MTAHPFSTAPDEADRSQNPSGSDWLAGGGEMGARIRAFDWSTTSLGPAASWPQSLRSAVSILLPSKAQIVLFWGRDLLTLYNDGYRPVFGAKHPRVLGLPVYESWRELWVAGFRELIEGVLHTGEAYWASDRPFFIERFEYPEETFFDVSYDPVRDETGQVGGVFCIVNETTSRVVGERRLKTLRDLSARTTEEAKTTEEACRVAARILAGNRHDLPFALIYLLDAEAKNARLAGSAGLQERSPAAPPCVDLGAPGGEPMGWPFRAVLERDRAEIITELEQRFGTLQSGVWPEPPHTAVVLPINASGQDRLAGFLVAGVSPRRPLDDHYRGFFDLVANQIATAIANAHAHAEERRRAEALAELDRAKTAFFSNVSHEFRTPLALMLGPLEDVLASAEPLSSAVREQLTVTHRNSLRLLKLVNTLLDFSRIESGRIQANYEPTDLAAATADLASVFRAAIERAGLRLVVDCPPLPDPAYVDREMWEKIVLNLMSNAFKFTFEGEIVVTLRFLAIPLNVIELSVRDTGTGITPEELPRIFDRFHRIEGARGRTHEGTGIGLALVRDLVELHAGTVEAQSIVGEGSIFTVHIPAGKSHLPADRIGGGKSLATTAMGAGPFVDEALGWLPTEDSAEMKVLSPESSVLSPDGKISETQHSACSTQHSRPRVLVADDNTDMREYVSRLLGARYDVQAVADGQAALNAARADRPDLVLSDIMMPRLDGFGLLLEMRADPQLREVPIILLSARAGEEPRIEGLEAGADDYLIKPFSARELLARVGAHLNMARVRRRAEAETVRSKLFLERMAASTPDMLFVFDIIEGRNVYMNRSLESVLGYTVEQFQAMPRDLTDFVIHPDDVPGTREWYARFHSAADEVVLEHEHRARHADGSYRWIVARASVFERTPDGRTKQIIGIARDITEHKQAEEALRKSEARLAAELADTKQLQHISGQLIQEDNVGALYQQILDAAITVMRSDVASMQMLYPERNELRLLASKGFHPVSVAFWEWVRLDSGSTCGAALSRGERVVVADIETCEFIVGTPDHEAYRRSDIRAVQSTPLVSRTGRVLGMISNHWRTCHEPSERDLRLLDVLARQAADLIERKQAEEALQQSHADLCSHAEELIRFNRVAVGRESRMIELKKEVNELCRRQGQAVRYPLEFEESEKDAHA